MKIYKASYYDEDKGMFSWFTSRKEAEKYLSREQDEGRNDFEITPCQFQQPDKALLIGCHHRFCRNDN